METGDVASCLNRFNGLGEALLRYLEGLRLVSYPDDGGVWTLGYGHTKDVGPNQTCTEQEAEAWLDQEVTETIRFVNDRVPKDMSSDKFSALVLFAYNVGLEGFATSTLLNCVKSLRYVDAVNEFQRWNHVKGVVNAKLTRRRAIERALFMLS